MFSMTPINMLCFISDKVSLTPLCISNFSQREREREREDEDGQQQQWFTTRTLGCCDVEGAGER